MKSLMLRFRASVEELSPEQLALLVSVGLVLGVFPVMGCPTVLCVLAALGLRLNMAALQLLNNISSPLRLALLLPLAHAGVLLCGGTAAAGGSWTGMIGLADSHAVAGWTCICVPLGGLLYVSLVSVMRRGQRSWSN
jgi:Uncharacterized protein conserved in bacteria (DUF2062)